VFAHRRGHSPLLLLDNTIRVVVICQRYGRLYGGRVGRDLRDRRAARCHSSACGRDCPDSRRLSQPDRRIEGRPDMAARRGGSVGTANRPIVMAISRSEASVAESGGEGSAWCSSSIDHASPRMQWLHQKGFRARTRPSRLPVSSIGGGLADDQNRAIRANGPVRRFAQLSAPRP
jgi:hypothetical protein